MKTSKKDLLKTAKLLGAVDLTANYELIDQIRPYTLVAYSVGRDGITSKLVYSSADERFYYAQERSVELFAL